MENLPSNQIEDGELINVLKSSLYPSASDNGVKLVIGYCTGAGLDPMQKPVHIVPMWDKNTRSMRDVVMPGIGLYRVQAARSGEYGGISEPEFGEDITEQIGSVHITYPLSCKVTVYRLVGGQKVEFSAIERWKENYAIKGGKERDISPNAMWEKRPYAQLAKCAEAQALRKAFPEFGAAPTAEEMEGKDFASPSEEEKVVEPTYYPKEDFDKNIDKWLELISEKGKKAEALINQVQTKGLLTEKQKQKLYDAEPQVIEGEFIEGAE